MTTPGVKTWGSETLQASDLNSYLMGQTVPRFASQAARDSAISSPSQGQMCWTASPNTLWIYESDNIASAQWVRVWTPWDAAEELAFSSGVTEGDGTWQATQRYEFGGLRIRGQFTLGSTSAVTSAPQIELDYALGSGNYNINLGQAVLRDTSAAQWYSASAIVGIGSHVCLIQATGGSNIDSTTPFTWASGDLILFDITVTPYPLDDQP